MSSMPSMDIFYSEEAILVQRPTARQKCAKKETANAHASRYWSLAIVDSGRVQRSSFELSSSRANARCQLRVMHILELQTHRRECGLFPLATANNPHTTRGQDDRIFTIAEAALWTIAHDRDPIVVIIAICALDARCPYAVSAQMAILHLVCSPLLACLDRRVALISSCWLSIHLFALYHSRMPLY